MTHFANDVVDKEGISCQCDATARIDSVKRLVFCRLKGAEAVLTPVGIDRSNCAENDHDIVPRKAILGRVRSDEKADLVSESQTPVEAECHEVTIAHDGRRVIKPCHVAGRLKGERQKTEER